MQPQVVPSHPLLDSLDEIMLALWGDHCPFNERVVNVPLTQGSQMFNSGVGHLILLDLRHFHKTASGGGRIGVSEVAHGG